MARRKLLQVANVCTMLGGPGALTWTITQALPDWDHSVIFVNSGLGPPLPEVRVEFAAIGVPVVKSPDGLADLCEEFGPDVTLLHNSSPQQVAAAAGSLRVYYQHSGYGGAVAARRECDRVVTVSPHQARLARLPVESVLYQPVPVPPGREDRGDFRVGRICTPNRQKWHMPDIVPLYERLAKDHPDVHWEFIGCPDKFCGYMREACAGHCSFNAASWTARGRLWSWQAMLYNSTLIESYGRTACEAQRAGCVPIVSDAGGFRDQIADKVDGFLCADHDAFSFAVEQLRDQKVYRQMKASAVRSGDSRGSYWTWRDSFLELIK